MRRAATSGGSPAFHPRKLLPKVTISIQLRRMILMPDLPVVGQERRRRAGELMRHILLDMLVATRPQRIPVQAFLDGKKTFGANYKLVGRTAHRESWLALLKMALGLSRVTGRMTSPGEIVGILTPNAAPTLGLVLGLSLSKRVPAMLNYTRRRRRIARGLHGGRYQNDRRLARLRREGAPGRCPRSTRRHHHPPTSKTLNRRRSALPTSSGCRGISYSRRALPLNRHPTTGHRALHLRLGGQTKGSCTRTPRCFQRRPDRAVADFAARQVHDGAAAFPSFGLTCGVLPLVSGCRSSLRHAAALPRHSGNRL